MDLQAIYDKAVAGVLGQGRQSKNAERDMCALRGVDGAKCAVGWLVPDEAYRAHMESQSLIEDYRLCVHHNEELDEREYDWEVDGFAITDLGKALVAVIGPLDYDRMQLLYELQTAHDSARNLEVMANAFCDVAELHKLSDAVAVQWLNEQPA